MTKTFDHGNIIAIDDVSLQLHKSEILSILGPSGCGKTTTLRVLAGLEDVDSGHISIDNKSVLGIPAHKRNVGLVFQDLALFPHKSVKDNIEFGLRMKGLPHKERDSKVRDILSLVELPLERFGDRLPWTLSGGQQQRVALARTLVVEPALVLFDEPMSALDRRLRDRMAVELRQIQKRIGVASIYVTHDQETASMMSDRLIVMEAGKIVQAGSPREVYEQPSSSFVADFIGDMNFVEANVVSKGDGSVTVNFWRSHIEIEANWTDIASNESVTLGIRPEDLRIVNIENKASIATGTLVRWHFISGMFYYFIRLDNETDLTIRSSYDERVAEGEQIGITVNASAVRLLRG